MTPDEKIKKIIRDTAKIEAYTDILIIINKELLNVSDLETLEMLRSIIEKIDEKKKELK